MTNVKSVDVEPIKDVTQIGEQSLWLIATYVPLTAYYDLTTPTNQETVFIVDLVIQRNANIEEWPFVAINVLSGVLLVLTTVTVYLFCDKVRRMT